MSSDSQLPESSLLKFIRLRQRECRKQLDIVSVKWIGGGNPNNCLDNAYRMIRAEDVTIVSGWLALPANTQAGHRQFTQHWWNYSELLRRHIDVSPGIEDGAIYILDNDIGLYAAEHNHKLTSCVPSSVLYRDNRFFTLDSHANGEFTILPIDRLTTEALFASYTIRAA